MKIFNWIYKEREFLFYFFGGLLLSFFALFLIIENPDLGWHLRSGKHILTTLSILDYDFMTWTKLGERWINSEWATQVIYYVTYYLGGYKGLYILRILNIFVMGFAVSFLIRLFDISAFNLIWVLPVFFLSALNLMDLRPDNYSVILFIFLLIFLYKRRDDNILSSKDFLSVTFLFVIWTNLHPAYTYGLVLILIHFLGMLLNENLNYIYGYDKNIKFDKSYKYLIIFLACFFATFINPYGYHIYSVFFEHFKNLSKYQSYITEWQDLDIDRINVLFFYIYTFVTVFIYLCKFLRKRVIDFVDVFMMIFFTFNAIWHIRLSIYCSVIMMLVFLKIFKENLNTLKYKIIMILAFLPVVYYISINIFQLEFVNLINNRYYISSGTYGSVDFIKNNYKYLKNLKMYNGWNIGGFLDFELADYKKTFMDGRYIFTDMLDEHINAFLSNENWEKFADKYGFDMAVLAITKDIKMNTYRVQIKGKKYDFKRPYYLQIFDFNKWPIIYFDKRTIIIVRRSSISSEFLKKNEYIFLKPYDFDKLYIDTLIDKKYANEIKKEIIKYNRNNFNNLESFTDVTSYIFYDMIEIEKGNFKYE